MQKVLMILGAGKNEIPAIEGARKLGIKTVVCDMNKAAPGMGLGDINVVAKTKDPGEYIDIARKNRIDGVMTVSVESLVRTVSAVANELGLAGLSPKAAENVTNKISMKKILQEKGIPCARFVWARDLNEARDKVKKLNYPLVIKPADSAGSRGVVKLKDSANLDRFFDTAKGQSKCGEVIIEEFIEGIESTIDSITHKGRTYILGISDKEKIHTPNIIAMDLTFPPRYSTALQKKVEDVVCAALQALGVDFGPSHIEVIVNDEGPKIVEVAGRAGGGLIPSDILPHLCGFDVIEKYIRLALGEDPKVPRYKLQNSVVLRFLKAPDKGVLDSIDGLEDARRIKNVLKIDFIVKKGDTLKPLKEDNDRVGFAIVKARTRAEAVGIADRVEKTIKFNIA